MMKMWLYLWALSPAILILGASHGTTAAPNQDANPSDTFNTILKIHVDTIREFINCIKGWESNEISMQQVAESILPMTQLSDGDYTVNITNHDLRRRDWSSFSYRDREISCSFGENLRVRATMPNFDFAGSMIISSNQSSPSTYEFAVNLGRIKYAFNAKPNFNIDDDLPNNQFEVDIWYDRNDIKVKLIAGQPRHSISEESQRFLARIKSLLQTMVYEKIATNIREKVPYSSLFASCMHFKEEIERKNGISWSEGNQYAHVINEANTDAFNRAILRIEPLDHWRFSLNRATLRINPVGIWGLLNFHSFTMSDLADGLLKRFSLRIRDLEGRTSLDYYFDGNKKNSTQFNFTIDLMLIQGHLTDYGKHWDDVSVTCEGKLSPNSDSENAYYWGMFSKAIISDRLKAIIALSLENRLKLMFNN